MNASLTAPMNAPVCSTDSFGRHQGITPAPPPSLGTTYRETERATPAPVTPRPDRGSDR